MSDRIPPGAFPDVARLLNEKVGKFQAFDSAAKAQAAMRVAVNEHDVKLKELENIDAKLTKLLSLPW